MKLKYLKFGSAIRFAGGQHTSIIVDDFIRLGKPVEVTFESGIFAIKDGKTGEVQMVGMSNVVQWTPELSLEEPKKKLK